MIVDAGNEIAEFDSNGALEADNTQEQTLRVGSDLVVQNLRLAESLGADRVHRLCAEYAAGNPGFVVPRSIRDRQLPVF